MKIANTLMFDIFELVEEILVKIKSKPDIAKRSLTREKVIDAIFYWLDHRYLPDRMRWAAKPSSALHVWCRALDIEVHDVKRNSGHDVITAHLEMFFNELLVDLVPHRTWKTMFIRRINETEFFLEIGEDYRIWYYMNHVHNKAITAEEG